MKWNSPGLWQVRGKMQLDNGDPTDHPMWRSWVGLPFLEEDHTTNSLSSGLGSRLIWLEVYLKVGNKAGKGSFNDNTNSRQKKKTTKLSKIYNSENT